MESKFGPEYDAIHNELINLHWTWQNFRHLFLDSPEDFKLFRELTEGFSIIAEFVLGNATVLAICRLTDPAKTGKHDNLSFDQLRDVLTKLVNENKLQADSAKLGLMGAKVDEIKVAAEPLKPYRDKFLAHFDLQHALNKTNLLPKNVLEIIDRTLKLTRELMNGIAEWEKPGEFGYETPISKGDADTLINCLRLSNEVWQARNDYHQGKITEEQAVNFLLRRQPYKIDKS